MNFHKYQGWNRVPWVPKFRSVAGLCHTLWVNIFLSNEITLSWTKPPNPNNKLTLCAIPSCLPSRDALPTAESSRLRDLCWRRHPLVGFLVCRRMRRQGSRGYFTTKSSLNTGVWTCFHLPKSVPELPDRRKWKSSSSTNVRCSCSRTCWHSDTRKQVAPWREQSWS